MFTSQWNMRTNDLAFPGPSNWWASWVNHLERICSNKWEARDVRTLPKKYIPIWEHCGGIIWLGITWSRWSASLILNPLIHERHQVATAIAQHCRTKIQRNPFRLFHNIRAKETCSSMFHIWHDESSTEEASKLCRKSQMCGVDNRQWTETQ